VTSAEPQPSPRRRATMSDVAAHAGVSLKSVSRVLNGEAHVTPALAERVRAAVADLGYRPDGHARRLAREAGRSRLWGYVQVDAANPFFSSVHRGLEDVALEHGLTILAGSTDADPERESRLLASLVEWRVEGLVIAAAEGADAVLREEVAHGTPLVCVDRVLDDLTCDTVVSDNRGSTASAVGHLLERGHRRVAFVGGDTAVWTAAERLAGYREAMAAHGVPVDERLVLTDVPDAAAAERAVEALLQGRPRPTAIFAAQDLLCAGTLRALHRLGMAQRVALFGFDEIPFADLLQPSVSVVAQQPYEMGRRAGELLLRRIAEGTPPGAPVFEVVPTSLRHRASGDIRPR
jgi:LacI family transcriptional regulator